MDEPHYKPVQFMGDSRRNLRSFPEDVKDAIGHALHIAQEGGKHDSAKPLRGFHGASVLEVVEDYAGDTYRAVYTVRFARRIYVLHVFQKKAKHGIATPQHDINLIKRRLRDAEQHHRQLIE